jgi:hypothetical protein
VVVVPFDTFLPRTTSVVAVPNWSTIQRRSSNVPVERHLFVAHVNELPGQAIELRCDLGTRRWLFTGRVHGFHGRLDVDQSRLGAVADIVRELLQGRIERIQFLLRQGTLERRELWFQGMNYCDAATP